MIQSRHRPCGHVGCEGQKQNDTSDDRRVRKVAAKTAVQLLDDNDCCETADHCHPYRKVGRKVHCEDHAGNTGTQILYSHFFAEKSLISPLEQRAACCADCGEYDRSEAKIENTCDEGRDQGDQDPHHCFLRVESRHQMGRRRNGKIIIIFNVLCIRHFWLASLTNPLPSLLMKASGRCAGQT